MKPKYSLAALPIVLSLFTACGPASSDTAASSPAPAATEPGAQSSGDAHLGAPKRRSGWWEFTSGTTGAQNLCVTDATEAVFSAFDQITQESLLGYKCSKTDFRRTGSNWAFDVACDTGIPAAIGGGVTTSKGTINGEISTSYAVQLSTSQAGQTRSAAIKAEWKGACPAGRKAGDLVIGSTVVNVLD